MANPPAGQRVLVVDDEPSIIDAVSTALRYEGFDVKVATTGRAALSSAQDSPPDLIVLDVMLPDLDGIEVTRRLRADGINVPVLFLTARDSLDDRVAGFEHGGDDYLVKPFAVAEMAARVNALCRRSGSGRPSVLRHDDLEMDCARREVRRAGTLLTLSDKEFAVLEFLLSRPGQAVGRDELIEHCWDSRTDPMSNVVDVVVRRLRLKLREPELIHTVRGRGYRLAAR
jgi:DNA-binding response OmpR family regulator